MALFPADSESRRTDARACAIVHYLFNTDHWQYREITGQDVGCDCEFELSENNYWQGHKIECQIKGTRRLDNHKRKSGPFLSFSLDTKTINYGLNRSVSFILLLVDVKEERVYYQHIQRYFSDRPELLEKVNSTAKTVTIRIPMGNVLDEDDSVLRAYAREAYIRGSTGAPQMVSNNELKLV